MNTSLWVDRILDALVYAVSVTLVFAVASALVSLPFGNILTGVKWGLFIIGWITLAYGSFQLRPTASWKRVGDDNEESGESGGRAETWFQAQTQRLPPLRRRSIPPERRFPPSLKLFISGVVILVTSFLMEAVFNVGG